MHRFNQQALPLPAPEAAVENNEVQVVAAEIESALDRLFPIIDAAFQPLTAIDEVLFYLLN